MPEVVVQRLSLIVMRGETPDTAISQLQQIEHLLGVQEGQSPCEVIVVMPEGRFRVSDPEMRVRLTNDMTRELERICGKEFVTIARD